MSRTILLASLTVLLVACSKGDQVSSRTPKGNPNAAVTVTEYADLQCPACRAAHTQIVAPLLKKYDKQIRFDHMHFPLRSIHRYALDAAEAAECAADQGKFWEYVDIDYANQDDLGPDVFGAWADELALDRDTFDRCMKSHAKRDLVLADYKEGRSLGVGGTPTFFLNGVKVETGFDTLSEAIDAELKGLTQRL